MIFLPRPVVSIDTKRLQERSFRSAAKHKQCTTNSAVKVDPRPRGAESRLGIGSKYRDVAGITTERSDLEGDCRLAGVMNVINQNNFSTQIMISKISISDFQRFSAIFSEIREIR